jgi:hypothetical protein
MKTKVENRAISILICTILFVWAGLFVDYVSCSAQSNLTNVIPMCEVAPEHTVARVLNELSLRGQDGEIMYRHGSPVYVSWCRNARFGCEQTVRRYVNIIWNESRAHGISPWVVLAQTYHESRFNAFAESHVGARGILQINPRSRLAQEVQFVRDRRFREQVCRHRPGHCQGQVIRTSISLLQRSLDRCGDLDKALNMYASGSCDRGYDYSSRVISYYQDFLWNG